MHTLPLSCTLQLYGKFNHAMYDTFQWSDGVISAVCAGAAQLSDAPSAGTRAEKEEGEEEEVSHPVDTGCLPLNHSGNPGVNVTHREGCSHSL